MKYDKVKRHPVQLLSLTGFTREEFEVFLPAFELQWQEYYSHSTLRGKPSRVRNILSLSDCPSVCPEFLFLRKSYQKVAFAKKGSVINKKSGLLSITFCQ